MAMLMLIVIALPGTDADATDLAALMSRYKEHTSEDLNDSNIKTAAQLWVSDPMSATSKYGLVRTWDVSQVTSLANVWCGSFESTDQLSNCGTREQATDMQSFKGNISTWDVSNVTTMDQSKSILYT